MWNLRSFGSIDRLRSMYMVCLHGEGRDSGDWGGQESEVCQDLKSHQELGEEALTERTLLGIEAERPKIQSE